MHDEIESAKVIVADPDIIKVDLEGGLVGTQLASQIRGYPEGEHLKAQEDKAKRLAMVKEAQSDGGARGDPDSDVDSTDSRDREREATETLNKLRGKGK